MSDVSDAMAVLKYLAEKKNPAHGSIELREDQRKMTDEIRGTRKDLLKLQDILKSKAELEEESGQGLMGKLFNFTGLASDTGPVAGEYLRMSPTYDEQGNEEGAGMIAQGMNFLFPDDMAKRRAFEQKLLRRGAAMMSKSSPDSTGSALTSTEKSERFPEWPSPLDQDNALKASAQEGIRSREEYLNELKNLLLQSNPNNPRFQDYVERITRGFE